jgi:hypothetical protein
MCGMMLRDQLSGTLNPIIGHSIEKFPGNSSKKTIEHNLYHHNPTKGRFVYTLPLWRPFGQSPGVLGAGNPL